MGNLSASKGRKRALITETQNEPLSRPGWPALQFAAADPAALLSTMSRGRRRRKRSLLPKLPIDHPPNPYGDFFAQTIQVTEVSAPAHSSREILALPAGTFPGKTKTSPRSLRPTPADGTEQKQRKGKLEVPRTTTLHLSPFIQPGSNPLSILQDWAMHSGIPVTSKIQHGDQ